MKDHNVVVEFRDKVGKEFTGWSVNLHVQFMCDVTRLKSPEDVELAWNDAKRTVKSEKLHSAGTVKDKWIAVQELDERSKGGVFPEHFIKLMKHFHLTLEEANHLVGYVDPMKTSQLMWRSEFISDKGPQWICVNLRHLNSRISDPTFDSKEEDKQIRSRLISCLYSLKAYREKLIKHNNHLLVILDCIACPSISQEDSIKVFLLLASFCANSNTASQVVSALRNFMVVHNESFLQFVKELTRPTGTVLFKVSFMTLLNSTLLATHDVRKKDILSNDYLENGITLPVLSNLLESYEHSDDSVQQQIHKQVQEYVEQAHLNESSKPKYAKITEENENLKRKLEEVEYGEDRERQEMKELKSQLKQVFEDTAKIEDIKAENNQLNRQLENLKYEKDSLLRESYLLQESLQSEGKLSAIKSIRERPKEIEKLNESLSELSRLKEENTALNKTIDKLSQQNQQLMGTDAAKVLQEYQAYKTQSEEDLKKFKHLVEQQSTRIKELTEKLTSGGNGNIDFGSNAISFESLSQEILKEIVPAIEEIRHAEYKHFLASRARDEAAKPKNWDEIVERSQKAISNVYQFIESPGNIKSVVQQVSQSIKKIAVCALKIRDAEELANKGVGKFDGGKYLPELLKPAEGLVEVAGVDAKLECLVETVETLFYSIKENKNKNPREQATAMEGLMKTLTDLISAKPWVSPPTRSYGFQDDSFDGFLEFSEYINKLVVPPKTVQEEWADKQGARGPPGPPALPGTQMNKKKPKAQKQHLQVITKVKLLFPNQLNGTIYSELNQLPNEKKLERELLLDSFEVASTNTAQKKNEGAPPPRETLLTGEGINMLSILLKRNQIDLPALIETLKSGTCKPPITLEHIEIISLLFIPQKSNKEKVAAEKEKVLGWAGYGPDEMCEEEIFMYTLWREFPNIQKILPITAWIENYYAKMIPVRKAIAKMEAAIQTLKSWQFKELINYALDITNILAEETGKDAKGFTLNSLMALTDTKSPKDTSQTLMNYLASQIAKKNPKLLEIAEEAIVTCGDALSSIMVAQGIFPEATAKYYEIADLMRAAHPVKNESFLREMKSFTAELQNVILEWNHKMNFIDRDISYFGGITYEDLLWAANVKVVEIKAAWKKLSLVLLESEVNARILRDCVRFVFFTTTLSFMKSLLAAHQANVDAIKKAESEKLKAEKRAAMEKLKESKKNMKLEGIDVLDSVKASLVEEKIVEETRNIASGQMVWRRMALRQKIASAVREDFSITRGARKTLVEEVLKGLREAFNSFEQDGSINTMLLGDILKSLGQNPSKEEIGEMVKKIDQDGNGIIEFEEFADFMASVESASFSSLQSAFSAIDENMDGKLDIRELEDVLVRLGEKPTQVQLLFMMKAAGQNADGEVNFDTFVKLMKEDFS
eukprot:TRINITY_DN3485_c0_g1_i3.p1 TRINITY_DN3485_c0_g1~~TRINITY_DN3485_c0_g1_i3.p1  ORF type:complete len:1474 (-),score=449.77 TRINITY_DN3485_c0_g1_i3:117-4313(-)